MVNCSWTECARSITVNSPKLYSGHLLSMH